MKFKDWAAERRWDARYAERVNWCGDREGVRGTTGFYERAAAMADMMEGRFLRGQDALGYFRSWGPTCGGAVLETEREMSLIRDVWAYAPRVDAALVEFRQELEEQRQESGEQLLNRYEKAGVRWTARDAPVPKAKPLLTPERRKEALAMLEGEGDGAFHAAMFCAEAYAGRGMFPIVFGTIK